MFWVFPPGHVWSAWLAYAIDPPGLIAARVLYAAFSVAATLALFLLARRIMPASFALLAGLLVATAAPRSHGQHLLFGYRYLVWSVVALLFFQRRLTTGDSRWLLPAGFFAGLGLLFRLSPAIAVSAAVAVGIVAASRHWETWLRDGLWYAAGILLVWIPVLAWFHQSVGLETFFIEAVVRPIEMTVLQGKPVPSIFFVQNWNRGSISIVAALVGFWVYPLLCGALLLALLVLWGCAVWARRPFDQALLLTFTLFSALYLVRSYGRADIPHLESVLAPIAVLVAFAASFAARSRRFRPEEGGRGAAVRSGLLCSLILAVWIFANGADRHLTDETLAGRAPVRSVPRAIKVSKQSEADLLDELIPIIRANSKPDDTILVMTHAPLLYVLAARHSPGTNDFMMPGTFRTAAQENAFLEVVRAEPPAVVIWPREHFDRLESRGLEATAPALRSWVLEHYRTIRQLSAYRVFVPEGRRYSKPMAGQSR